MSKNKFVGVAYWTATAFPANWLGQATVVLQPLQDAGMAQVVAQATPVGDQLTITFDDEAHNMVVNHGNGRGIVRVSTSASMFVVCLVALRKVLGNLAVVTDSQEPVYHIPRQTDPLFAADWQRVQPIAQELGLIISEKFVARHKSILQNVF